MSQTGTHPLPLSNSAKIASRAAIARPAGVVRSRASVTETKPTPRALQFLEGRHKLSYGPAGYGVHRSFRLRQVDGS
jgi:hypothetical protein